MTDLLWLLWPFCGWLCFFGSTPKWMLDVDPFGYAIGIVCGAVVGPFGVFWFFDGSRK